MKFKRIFVFTILAFLTASCDGVFEKKSNQIFSLKEIQSNIANFLEDYAASGQGATPKKRILNSPMLNTPNKESSTSNEGSFTITVNTSYKNPYEFVDKNQVYDFGDAFALCEILKLLGIEDFNGEVFRLIDGNGFDSFYDITSFEGIEDAIEVNSVFYSLSFDDYFILNTFDNFVGFRDKNISIDCTGDFTSEGDLNKLYDEAVKLGNKHFTKEYIEASFQASRSRSKKILNQDFTVINLDDYTWYNDYTKPTNISMQFICKKYYYHCASKVPYDSYVYDDPSGIFRTTDNNNTNMAANSLAMGGLAFAYIPDGVRKIVYDYEWDCINIPSSVEEIENDRFDFSNLKYVFIDKNSSIIESLSSELIESNPNVKIYSSDNYHICEAVFVINK